MNSKDELMGQKAGESDKEAGTGLKDRLLETAWGIIANAGSGDWEMEAPDWRGAAERFRDTYMGKERLTCKPKDCPSETTYSPAIHFKRRRDNED